MKSDIYVAKSKYSARRVFCKKTVATVPARKTGLGDVERAYIGKGLFIESLCPMSLEVDG